MHSMNITMDVNLDMNKSTSKIGLSTTAIGGRPFQEALEIYYKLEEPLGLDFIELGVGVLTEVTEVNLPYMIHNGNSLSIEGNKPKRFNILKKETWVPYIELGKESNCLGMTIHGIPLSECTEKSFIEACLELQQEFKYFAVETMFEEFHAGSWGYMSLLHNKKINILVDLSHINIWTKGNEQEAYVISSYFVKLSPTNSIHISTNKGKRDSHDMIPEEHIFLDFLYSGAPYITYEAVPNTFAEYQRLDKKRIR